MLSFLFLFFGFTFGELLLFNNTVNNFTCFPLGTTIDLPEFTYCNEYGYATSNQFVDLKTPFLLNQSCIVAYMNIAGSPSYITYINNSYVYHDDLNTIPLNDCSGIKNNTLVWDPIHNRVWSIVQSITFNNSRLFFIDRVTRATGYNSILTGEKPIFVYWNGTEINAIIIRNQTYYSVAFLISIRARFIGSSVNTLVDIVNGIINLYPMQENTINMCQFSCTIPQGISIFTVGPTNTSEHNETSFFNASTEFNSIENSTLEISISLTKSEKSTFVIPTSKSISFSYIYSNNDIVDVTNGPILIDGIMYIPPGSYLEVFFPPESLTEGTTITVFTFSQLYGQFDYITLHQTSCYVFDTRITYGTNAIAISILSASDTCDNASINRIFVPS